MRRAAVFAIAATVALASGVVPADDARVQVQNGVEYVTGGVGEAEQDALARLAAQGFTLRVVFAEAKTGAFVSDVRVRVADPSGRTLVEAVTNGPAFLAKLPAGQYALRAEYGGTVENRTLRIGAGAGATMTIHFPAA